MDLNFDDFRGESFSIDGKKLQTFEDCKEWLALKSGFRTWNQLSSLTANSDLIKIFENQAMDLYTYLLAKGQIEIE